MKKTSTYIDGLYVIKNTPFLDNRGKFFELWNAANFQKENLKMDFFQDNLSISKKYVLRGLHFQKNPHGQIKYVQVIKGKVLDVAVDIRKKSKTYGKHFAIELSEKNHNALWIPEGFAHGFLALEEENIFLYKCSGKYNPKAECTIKWDDSELAIKWGISNPIVSEKDNRGVSFQTYRESNSIKG